MKKLISIFSVMSMVWFMYMSAAEYEPIIESETVYVKKQPKVAYENVIDQKINILEKDLISNSDIDLLAIVTMAEAEGECEEGKRLVIDTILNRMDSEYFPDTIYDVVYQPDQFTSMWNGRAERCYVTENIRQLVIEELKSRTNYDVIFFRTKHYSKYGTPMFSVENHYFSSY